MREAKGGEAARVVVGVCQRGRQERGQQEVRGLGPWVGASTGGWASSGWASTRGWASGGWASTGGGGWGSGGSRGWVSRSGWVGLLAGRGTSPTGGGAFAVLHQLAVAVFDDSASPVRAAPLLAELRVAALLLKMGILLPGGQVIIHEDIVSPQIPAILKRCMLRIRVKDTIPHSKDTIPHSPGSTS
jgi:hypothetical protein